MSNIIKYAPFVFWLLLHAVSALAAPETIGSNRLALDIDGSTLTNLIAPKSMSKDKNQSCNYAVIAIVPPNTNAYEDQPGNGAYKYRGKSRNEHGDSKYNNEISA